MKENERNKISVIIVYTDAEKLSEAELWIEKQSVISDTQIIALDNRENRFSSAAMALNYGAGCAQGNILIFMHQDVYLWDLDAIEKIYSYLFEHPTAIVGIAGRNAKEGVVTDIYETKDKLRRGVRAYGEIMQITALDECLFAMTKGRWSELRFDEVCCDNWHGYAMDICFNNILHGGQNILLPLEVCHESRGNPRNDGFRNTVRNLVRKYRETDIKRIVGTCIDIRCTRLAYAWYRVKEYLKDILDKPGILKYWYVWKEKHCI